MRMLGYVTEFEMVATRWAEDDHTMLQPTEPCWMWPMCLALAVMVEKSLAKEQELCGTVAALHSHMGSQVQRPPYIIM
jgi:hypothetical protein